MQQLGITRFGISEFHGSCCVKILSGVAAMKEVRDKEPLRFELVRCRKR